MNTYKAFYLNRTTEVTASTTQRAHELAVVKFGAKDSYKVVVELIAKDGVPIIPNMCDDS